MNTTDKTTDDMRMLALILSTLATAISRVASFSSKRRFLTIGLVVGMSLTFGVAPVRAQSAADGFNPEADLFINVVVRQPDGKILIGGMFRQLNFLGDVPISRNRIARLNPDGTVDALFDPNANGDVYAIALQADGKILVGGDFTTIRGVTRNHIARLDPITGAADSFNPNANDTVRTLVEQADGTILAGGEFTSIGGEQRRYLAKLSNTSGAATLFDAQANDEVYVVALQSDRKILVGGRFRGLNSIGGQTRNHIARLDPDTGLADSFDPNARHYVEAFAVQADGKILVGGLFAGENSIGGQNRNWLVRLDPNTGLADSFDPHPNNEVKSIAIQPDGKIVVGGGFTQVGGQSRDFIARLDPTTALADSFNPGPTQPVNDLEVLPDGKVLLVGSFFWLNLNGGTGARRFYIARVEADGTLDQNFNDLSWSRNPVTATAVQADGKVLVGGDIGAGDGPSHWNLMRLNTNGTVDWDFRPNPNSTVFAILVQPDGKIVIGGTFRDLNPNGGALVSRGFLARLNSDGSIDPTFNTAANDSVLSLALQPDGKILVGGMFTSIGGQPRNHIARVDSSGVVDSFNPNANDRVWAVAVQRDGKVLAGGYFNGIGGQGRAGIARLDPVTGLADSFNPAENRVILSIAVQPDGWIVLGGLKNQAGESVTRVDPNGLRDSSFITSVNDLVRSVTLQADGKVLVGGDFSSVGFALRNRVARLKASGALDSFNPNGSGNIFSLTVLTDGKIIVGGKFNGDASMGGQTRTNVARLTNDTAAWQDLAVTQNSIRWNLGGSSPQFSWVTYEYSVDNVNYSSLGTATPTGSNWKRDGLNLTTGMNIYIRARGYRNTGNTGSITETVRRTFIAGPTSADSSISGKIVEREGAPIPGVVVNLSGASLAQTITDAKGSYRFDNVETNGFYTVTPSHLDYEFTPASRSFSQLGDHTDIGFMGLLHYPPENYIDTPQHFVRQQYLDFLGREPDEAGFNFWTNQLIECGIDINCLERGRVNVSAAYFLSIEFQETGGLVNGLYRASYGRRPFYVEFGPDSSGIAEDVIVGRQGWQQRLETNKEAFIDAWVQRPAFQTAYDRLTNDTYVDHLIAHTGVSYAAQDRDALVAGLTSGSQTRATVLRSIVENQSFVRAKFNEAFVMMQYFGYLRRDPDEAGYQFWLRKLNEFNGNFEQAEMVKAFLMSGEYRQRFR